MNEYLEKYFKYKLKYFQLKNITNSYQNQENQLGSGLTKLTKYKSAYDELVVLHKQECIVDATINHYKGFEYLKHDGLRVVKILKGSHLYKGHNGYITPKMEQHYLSNINDYDIMWVGNKHRAFQFVYSNFTGLNSYIVTKDIYLLDYFNYDNLKLLFKKVNLPPDIIKRLKIEAGFDVNKKEQMKLIKKIRPIWGDNIWLNKTPQKYPYSGMSCDSNEPLKDGLLIANPLTYNYKFEKDTAFPEIMKYLFSIGISGIYRKQHANIYNWERGIFNEEIMIPATLFHKKILLRDTKDTVDWVNWEKSIEPEIWNLIKDGIIIPTDLAHKNFNYSMFKFFLKYPYKKPIKRQVEKNTFSLLTFNVHSWISIDSKSQDETISLISNMIKDYNPDYVILQEVSNINKVKLNKTLLKYFPSYPYQFITLNGTKYDLMFIVCISKIPFTKIFYVKLPTERNIHRNAIVFKHNNITIAGVHLEIGGKYHNLLRDGSFTLKDKKVIDIIDNNQRMRSKQLKKLISIAKPDIILGDFNFDIDDIEFTYLTKMKYYLLKEAYSSSNPFGTTTDMIFAKDLKYLKNPEIISCNYSDHLPVLQVVKKLS
jgi:endonuclease/exonuclease/phosphatase family metal-dependent hydrolase